MMRSFNSFADALANIEKQAEIPFGEDTNMPPCIEILACMMEFGVCNYWVVRLSAEGVKWNEPLLEKYRAYAEGQGKPSQ